MLKLQDQESDIRVEYPGRRASTRPFWKCVSLMRLWVNSLGRIYNSPLILTSSALDAISLFKQLQCVWRGPFQAVYLKPILSPVQCLHCTHRMETEAGIFIHLAPSSGLKIIFAIYYLVKNMC